MQCVSLLLPLIYVSAVKTVKNLNLLLLERSNSGELEGCVMWDYNYEAAVKLGYEGALANASLLMVSNDTLACPVRSFNHSQQEHTFVTEVNLEYFILSSSWHSRASRQLSEL